MAVFISRRKQSLTSRLTALWRICNQLRRFSGETRLFFVIGDSHVHLTSRLRVVNFPCTDWLSYLRAKLKAFVGGICLRSRFFFALFSRIRVFRLNCNSRGICSIALKIGQ